MTEALFWSTMKNHYTLDKPCQICGAEIEVFCRPYTFEQYRKKPKSGAKYCKKCRKTKRQNNQIRYRYSRLNDDNPIGFRRIDKAGYIVIKTTDGTYKPEHREVMAKILKRPLKSFEIAHHKDFVKTNNDETNLELWLKPHCTGVRASDFLCPHCGKTYFPTPEIRE